MRRGRPMRQVSEKRQGRRYDRDNAVERAFRRDRYTCQAERIVPSVECHGRLDPHERIPRSAWADGIYEPDNIITVCRAHHHWIDAHPAEAHTHGLHGYAHERNDHARQDDH